MHYSEIVASYMTVKVFKVQCSMYLILTASLEEYKNIRYTRSQLFDELASPIKKRANSYLKLISNFFISKLIEFDALFNCFYAFLVTLDANYFAGRGSQ